ncbi:hypothetical protein FDUTEX481_03642 [Tolypothrix sp. PCC 7601]|nr:hypothetical protein FDUTEX481_03642 [Tolypothrix sp. PCC 7601]
MSDRKLCKYSRKIIYVIASEAKQPQNPCDCFTPLRYVRNDKCIFNFASLLRRSISVEIAPSNANY